VQELAKLAIEHELRRYADDVEVEVTSDNKCTIYVPERDIAGIIGKEGKNIQMLEKVLGIGIDVQELKGKRGSKGGIEIPFKSDITQKSIVLYVSHEYAGKSVAIYVDGRQLMTANVGRDGDIRVGSEHKFGKTLKYALQNKGKVEVKQ